jgi:hypothetical protein
VSGITAQELAAFHDEIDGGDPALSSLLEGKPLDPTAIPGEPLEPLSGFPFIVAGVTAIVPGPTARGRSQLAEAMLYDAAKAGLRGAYLGMEVTEDEFNARGRAIAEARGDELTDALLEKLANVRYLKLPDNIATAWTAPDKWVRSMAERYPALVIDPLSSVASTLELDFDNNTSISTSMTASSSGSSWPALRLC